MRTFGNSKKRKTELNMTSLIDVVFMLLIFFMIGSNFEKPALTVNLPSAVSGERIEGETVEISIDANGYIFLNGETVSEDDLVSALFPFVERNPNVTASLSCDKNAPFGKAAIVLDAVKKAGVQYAALRHEYPH